MQQGVRQLWAPLQHTSTAANEAHGGSTQQADNQPSPAKRQASLT
jgi:hypothetical protein